MSLVCGYEISPKLGHNHNYTRSYSDSTGHWKICDCGDKVFVSSHFFGNGYRCTSCGYVDEARRKAIEEAQMFGMMSAAISKTASVTCYNPEGKPIAKCFSKANADYVNIKVNAQYAGYAIVIKNGKTVVDTGILDKNGRYTFKGAVTGVAYKGVITKIAKPMIISTKATENSVTIKWNAVEGAEKYKVYKYVDGKLKAVGTTTKTSAKIGKLDSETEYGFAVKAYVDGKWTSVKMADVVYATTK